MEHVRAVADGLVDFDLDVQIAGMLHDVVEDTETTLDDLRAAGVSERSLAAIELVSLNLHAGLTYAQAIERITCSRDATLVKIADNAHNSRPDRVAALQRRRGSLRNRSTPRHVRSSGKQYPQRTSPRSCDALLQTYWRRRLTNIAHRR